MENIDNIKNSNQELYEQLKQYNCKVKYNDIVLYEGIFNNNIDYKKYNPENVVYEFNINNKQILMTAINNDNINKLKQLFENRKFDNIYEDAKLFNKAMNLANKLPLYNFDNSLFEENIQKNIKKYGINFKKIYENYILLNLN